MAESEVVGAYASPCVSNSTAVQRLAGRLAGPEHELERLIIPLAGVDRRLEQHLALTVGRLRAPGEQERVAEHHYILGAPQIEMPDPQLLVDERDQLQDLGAPRAATFRSKAQATCTASTSGIQVKAMW